MHSNNSLDGDISVADLMKRCHESGLKKIALADHNTIRGVKEFILEGEKYGITVIPAIEIDCHYKGVNLHVLAYNFNPESDVLNKFETDINEQEQRYASQRIKLIEDMGFYINKEKLNALIVDGVVTGEMIAEALLYEEQNAYDPRLVEYYGEGKQADNPLVNFYWEFCSQGKPGYVHIEYPTLDDTLKVIKDNDGIAVLAHPGNNTKEDLELLNNIMNLGIEGIEAISSYHSNEQLEFYVKYANENNYFITCGSDFHGKTKPSIHLGVMEITQEIKDGINERLFSI